MHEFNAALCRRLADAGVTIEAVYACVFHPTEGIGEYRRESTHRKPQSGMFLQAAAEHNLDLAASFTIGDKWSDVLAGRAAGCRTILLSTVAVAPDRDDAFARPDFMADNLLEAARAIERASAAGSWELPAPDAAPAFGGGSGWEHSESVP
jgi:D-glycero-D-manno-heptose 1,7-bisphosphate phosphatase